MASSSIREVTSSATLEEKKKLRKEFTSFDMIFYTVSALIDVYKKKFGNKYAEVFTQTVKIGV